MIIGVSTNGKVFIHTCFREEIRHVLFTLKKWNRKWQMRTILKTLILLVVTWPQRRVLRVKTGYLDSRGLGQTTQQYNLQSC